MSAGDTPWYRSVLGAELARWNQDGLGGYTRVAVEEALGDVEVVALYFPPLLGDDLADRLAELHDKVNAREARLRVVQVLTPLASSPASPTSPSGQKQPHLHVPWFAVPPDDYDRQVSVCMQTNTGLSRMVFACSQEPVTSLT